MYFTPENCGESDKCEREALLCPSEEKLTFEANSQRKAALHLLTFAGSLKRYDSAHHRKTGHFLHMNPFRKTFISAQFPLSLPPRSESALFSCGACLISLCRSTYCMATCVWRRQTCDGFCGALLQKNVSRERKRVARRGTEEKQSQSSKLASCVPHRAEAVSPSPDQTISSSQAQLCYMIVRCPATGVFSIIYRALNG